MILFSAGVNQQPASCHVVEPFQTQFRGLASYIIPTIDVQLSTGIQLKPGTGGLGGNDAASNGSSLNANYNLPNAQVLAILGRPLVGGGANLATNLLVPGREVRGPGESGRSQSCEDHPRRQDAQPRWRRSLQPVQCQPGAHLQPGVRPELPSPVEHSDATVRAFQRHGRSLITSGWDRPARYNVLTGLAYRRSLRLVPRDSPSSRSFMPSSSRAETPDVDACSLPKVDGIAAEDEQSARHWN